VQPYFIGDFYPLLSYTPILDLHSLVTDAWTAWQWDRPDLKSGIVLLLRRQDSPLVTIQPHLHGIDPTAMYSVETRTGLEKGDVERLTGKELENRQFTISSKPGSALILYHRLSRP
jgi:hypothetical protein